MRMNTFLADNLCDIEFIHWTNISEMSFSHTHPQFEIYFCSDNVEQRSVINGVEYTYKYPCVIISSPYTVHAMSCAAKDAKRYERFVIYFDDSVASQLRANLIPEGILCRNSGFMFKLSEQDANYLKNMIIAVDPNNKTEIKLLIGLFLNKLVTLSPLENAICIGKASFYVQDVLQYIADNFADPISSETIARKFLISRSKLDRDFKQFTGISVHAFIEICRLNQAKMLLETHTEMSVANISAACGFIGETYFFPFFKKNVGLTPIEYRRTYKSHN